MKMNDRWWTEETVAIVTGGNKGIGYEIVKKLCELGLTVILTARDSQRGSQALHSLQQHRRRLHFFCLDVADPSSIKAFVSWFSRNFSALDILVSCCFFLFLLLETRYNKTSLITCLDDFVCVCVWGR